MKQFSTIIYFVAIILLVGCKNNGEIKETKETFVLSNTMLNSTTTSKAKLQTVKTELNFYGKITTDNNKMIEIYPIVGGNVISVNIELGDYVKKGQILASIRSTEVADFDRQLIHAKNDLLVETNNLKVTQELFEGKLNSEREVLEAKSRVEKAKAQLNSIQETYKIYNIGIGSLYEVRAPIDGFIIQKSINEGMILRSDNTNNIFDIADIKDVWALANVNENDINLVKLGVDAQVSTLSSEEKVFYGKVDKIFNIIDPETKAMEVRIKLSNPGYLLKPEMLATIKLTYNADHKMIGVPSEAIIFDKNKYFVMIFNSKNDIQTRLVEVYSQVGDVTYIKHGLKNNERVITHNQLLIYDALND